MSPASTGHISHSKCWYPISVDDGVRLQPRRRLCGPTSTLRRVRLLKSPRFGLSDPRSVRWTSSSIVPSIQIQIRNQDQDRNHTMKRTQTTRSSPRRTMSRCQVVHHPLLPLSGATRARRSRAATFPPPTCPSCETSSSPILRDGASSSSTWTISKSCTASYPRYPRSPRRPSSVR